MLRAVDHVLRFAYVLLAPAILVLFGALIPVTGIIVSASLATIVALVGTERFRARLAGHRVLQAVFGGMTRLGDYYAEYPPKPLVYYILYPVLVPYWLFVARARRELLLYRKLGAVTMVILLATAALEYVRLWRPIPFTYFMGMFIATLIFQLLVTFALVMPIVTTVIAFHQRGKRKTLIGLMTVAVLLGGVVAVVLHIKQPIAASAKMRVNARTVVEKDRAVVTLQHALDAYAAANDPAAAVPVLEELYRPDEARAFKFYSDADGVLIYLKSRHGFVFLGRAANGRYINKVEALSAGARTLLNLL